MLNHQYLVVRRVDGDRGSVVVNGAGEFSDLHQHCPHCGEVGHVAYLAPSVEAVERERDMVIGSTSGGDSAFECVWCDAVFTTRDLVGPEAFDQHLREYLSQWPRSRYYIRNAPRR